MLLRLVLFFLLLMTTTLSAEGLYLRDLLTQAQPGDYIVMAQGRNFVLLLIRDHQEGELTLEEITLPEEKKSKSANWNQWVLEGAPGNSSWTTYRLSLKTGAIIECYSYTKRGWCDIPASENFLGTLLQLPLEPLDPSLRRRVGAISRQPQQDKRPLWNPPLVLEGKQVPDVQFNAWRTRWPQDTSEMSNKLIDLYLPKAGSPGLGYFPYWIQIGGAVGKAQVRIVDSGLKLSSPKPLLPLRPLQFAYPPCWQEGVFRLWLQTRPYHGQVRLFAIDAVENSPPRPIPYKLRRAEDPNVQILEVSPESLKNLQIGHSYRWKAVSLAGAGQSTETTPLLFNPPLPILK